MDDDRGLRERKKDRTRQRLVGAALRLFAEHGYDDTTVEMIADAATVSPRTFFRYFATKDAVLAEPASQLLESVIEYLRAMDVRRPDHLELLRLVAEHVQSQFAEGQLAVLIRGSRQHPELAERAAVWRQRWSVELAAGLASLDDRDEPTFEQRVVAGAVVALTGCVIDEWIARGERADLAHITEEIVALLWGAPST